MTDQEIADRVRAIAEAAGFYAGPTSEEEVAAVERELGLKLPRSYRIFLRECGAGVCGINMIYGIPSDCCGHSVVDAYETTRYWHAKTGTGLNLIPISSNGGDVAYSIDTAVESEPGENPVVAWGGFPDCVIAGLTFLDFIENSHTGGGWEPAAFPRTLPDGRTRV